MGAPKRSNTGATSTCSRRRGRPASWISASDVALAAVRAFEKDITGHHEFAGPDRETFDGAYVRLARGRRRKLWVLHPPLVSLRVPGLIFGEMRELANMFALFDAVGYAADPAPLRERFGRKRSKSGRVSRTPG